MYAQIKPLHPFIDTPHPGPLKLQDELMKQPWLQDQGEVGCVGG